MPIHTLRRVAARASLAVLALLAAHAAAAPARAQIGQCPSVVDESKLDKGDPFRMYVFGDSVMWGEGLRDRNKFWCRVKQWVEGETGRSVKERLFAHAGATIEAPPGEFDLLEHWYPHPFGDINLSFPTIRQQVEEASKEFGWEREKVALVLVDGCINDVDFRNMLRVENTEKAIEGLTDCKCRRPMARLLASLTAQYPNATIVVTGYYPLVFEGATDEIGGQVNGTSGNLPVSKAIAFLGGAASGGAMKSCQIEPPAGKRCRSGADCRRHLAALSRAWYKASNDALAGAVEESQRKAGGPRVLFARINFPAEYAFSTQQSMLWNVGFGATNLYGLQKALVVVTNLARSFRPNDERFSARSGTCDETYRELKKRVAALKHDYPDTYRDHKDGIKRLMNHFGLGCRYASLGHPNKFGAALYAQAVVSRLESLLPETNWKRAGAGPTP